LALNNIIILGIESSCDDTSAAILVGTKILSNVTATQLIHEKYGGVVPELASRAHQENILPVVKRAIEEAGITLNDIEAVAFTQGPGLLGSLVVGVSFAKAFALAQNIPLLAVHHMKAHILAHFIDDMEKEKPTFPFLCLTVSGGHTQIVLVESHLKMSILGKTIDDAAGEAFDKAAKMLGFSYPGGPLIDKFAQLGNPDKFTFSKPRIQGLDFSFSGLKTSILYSIRDAQKENPNFIEENRNDLCASIQKSIVTILIQKLELAVQQTGIYQVALAGGVSANSELRKALNEKKMDNWKVFIPKFEYCTDNAAMIAIAGKFLFDSGDFATQAVSSKARMNW
jgi:N6-L-threonylcarbamoyladenine synthase